MELDLSDMGSSNAKFALTFEESFRSQNINLYWKILPIIIITTAITTIMKILSPIIF